MQVGVEGYKAWRRPAVLYFHLVASYWEVSSEVTDSQSRRLVDVSGKSDADNQSTLVGVGGDF
jgi:hypothetical protein